MRHYRVPTLLHQHGMKHEQLEKMLFGAFVLIHCIPLWVFSLFPTQDGPSHVYNSAVLATLFFHSDSPLHSHYLINHDFDPNWTSHLFMAIVTPAVGAISAERLFLTLYVIGFPLAMWYCLTARPKTESHSSVSMSRENQWLVALLVFPFIYGYTLHMGFYNFNFSLVIFLGCIGFYVRHAVKMTSAKTLVLGILVLLLYFSHPVSLVAALLAMTAMAAWNAALNARVVRRESRRYDLQEFFFHLVKAITPIILAFFPALLLLAGYLVRSGDGEALSAAGEVNHGFVTRGLRLFSLSTLVSFSSIEFLFSCVLVLILAVLTMTILWQRWLAKQIFWSDGFLFMAGGFVVLFFISPDELAGGSVMEPRLEIFPYISLLLWIGSNSLPKFGKKLAIFGSLFCSIGLLVTHATTYSRYQSELSEYLTAIEGMDPHSTILILDPGRKKQRVGEARKVFRVDPLRHAGAYIALYKDAILLSNYEAAHSYFPVQFRSTHNPYHQIGAFHRDPLNVRLIDENPDRVIEVDYVVTCGMEDETTDLLANSGLRDQLDKHFELIRSSAPLGLLRVYHRNHGLAHD